MGGAVGDRSPGDGRDVGCGEGVGEGGGMGGGGYVGGGRIDMTVLVICGWLGGGERLVWCKMRSVGAVPVMGLL